MADVVLAASGIRKAYGGVQALRGCDLHVAPGTVHALLGENGAGKSTMVKVLTGAVRPDSGEIRLDGELANFSDAVDAARHGVAVVSQELNLFPDLDVVGNLFLRREILRSGFFNRRAMTRRAEPVLAELGLHVPPGEPVGRLSLAQRQLVEIAKALLTDPRVLILDEPTSALDDEGSERLLHVLRVLRDRQVAVVFVSHILEEVMALSDTVTVLRDGEVVMQGAERAGLTMDAIVTAMLGDHSLTEVAPDRSTPVASDVDDATSLRLDEIRMPRLLDGVTLRAHCGEIVGLAGVVGAGHRAVLEAIAGVRRLSGGTVRLPASGRPRRPPRSLPRAVRSGVAVVSGDRKRGLLFDRPIWVNVAQVRSVALARDGTVLRRSVLRSRARERVEELDIKTSGVEQPVSMLSGGNQQKVVLAKWIEAAPSVLLLDDPTRGVAIGSKADIHRLLREASHSTVILLCSTDLDELVSLCDRVLVFRRGKLRRELRGADLNRHRLLSEMNAPDS